MIGNQLPGCGLQFKATHNPITHLLLSFAMNGILQSHWPEFPLLAVDFLFNMPIAAFLAFLQLGASIFNYMAMATHLNLKHFPFSFLIV
jgi:hypothetical protein